MTGAGREVDTQAPLRIEVGPQEDVEGPAQYVAGNVLQLPLGLELLARVIHHRPEILDQFENRLVVARLFEPQVLVAIEDRVRIPGIVGDHVILVRLEVVERRLDLSDCLLAVPLHILMREHFVELMLLAIVIELEIFRIVVQPERLEKQQLGDFQNDRILAVDLVLDRLVDLLVKRVEAVHQTVVHPERPSPRRVGLDPLVFADLRQAWQPVDFMLRVFQIKDRLVFAINHNGEFGELILGQIGRSLCK